MSTKVWAALVIGCSIPLLFVAKDYYKGMTLRFALLCFNTLIGDAILKHRLDIYLKGLNTIT